jgi:signal transduction histidine kinase
MADRPATAAERSAILAALPGAVRAERFAGGVASVLVDHDGHLLDGLVVLADPLDVAVRTLPQRDREGLDLWLSLLDRRRAQLAHDTSGQATGVLAAIETVLEYEPITDGTRALLQDARGGIFRAMKILGDRSSALTSPANVVAEPLDASIERLARSAREAIDPQGTRLHLAVSASREVARFDASVVEGGLAVLLSNAWKFRRGQEARVAIDATVEDGALQISVSDDGRGADAATLRAAGELGFSTRPSGVGIGLFMLRRAVSAQGGAIVLTGSRPGLRASVLLPLNTLTDHA